MVSTSVIIVTFNNEATIKKCVDSINSKNPGCEIIVVDNNSIDKTAEIIRQIKNVKLLNQDTNLGFSKGVNIGAKESSGDYLVLINPDTELKTKDGLTELVTILEDNPEYAVIGPKFANTNGSIQPSVRNFPTIINAVKEYVFKIKGSYDFYLPKCDSLCSVETVYGACIVIKKDIYQKFKGLDEKFFMYYEEIDLCRKIKNLGLKVGYEPTVEIIHEVGHSGKGQKTGAILVESAKKYHGLLEFYMIQLILRLSRYVHI
jgi:N-acetylglucosaminyl-diphospho-decaprenol L-rhamnosyltransferase